jgi:hypothetical protein
LKDSLAYRIPIARLLTTPYVFFCFYLIHFFSETPEKNGGGDLEKSPPLDFVGLVGFSVHFDAKGHFGRVWTWTMALTA